jgi:membrane-bound lytic murein transglycosylase C
MRNFITATLVTCALIGSSAFAAKPTLSITAMTQDDSSGKLEDYKSYRNTLRDAASKEIGSIRNHWDEPVMSSRYRWAVYSPDYKTRALTDFSEGYMLIETAGDDPLRAKLQLQRFFERITVMTTLDVIKKNPVYSSVQQLNASRQFANAPIPPDPVVQHIFFDPGTSETKRKQMIAERFKSIDVMHQPDKGHSRFSVIISFPKDAVWRMAKQYEHSVLNLAKRYKLPTQLLFAIIHTESNYNPLAVDGFNRFGLMQLVPYESGFSAYTELTNKRRFPSVHYLFNTTKNMELGVKYFHTLFYERFGAVTDETARLFCTIVAYRGGEKSVWSAFDTSFDKEKALARINALPSTQVYHHLLGSLRFDDAKTYLKYVVSRMAAYHQLLGAKSE